MIEKEKCFFFCTNFLFIFCVWSHCLCINKVVSVSIQPSQQKAAGWNSTGTYFLKRRVKRNKWMNRRRSESLSSGSYSVARQIGDPKKNEKRVHSKNYISISKYAKHMPAIVEPGAEHHRTRRIPLCCLISRIFSFLLSPRLQCQLLPLFCILFYFYFQILWIELYFTDWVVVRISSS